MSAPVICSSCGARLRLPPGRARRKGRCPKCGTRIVLAAACDDSAYLPATPPPRQEDPLPDPDRAPAQPDRPAPLPLDDDAPLSLDDEPLPIPLLEPAAPLRVPVCVTADSAALLTGPCAAVIVPHGLFLETVPFQPFLYIPVGVRVEESGRRGLVAELPDGRKVSLSFAGRGGSTVAAFLVGTGPMPDARAVRGRPVRVVAAAAAIVLAAATIAVLADRGGREENAAAPQPVPQPAPPPVEPKPDEPPPRAPRRPPTILDRAAADGVYRFDDGPDEVTALGISPDASTLVIGYRNGATRVWNFAQPSFDPIAPGPRCDGAPTRIEFDATGTNVYLSCSGGLVAAPLINPPTAPVKIPGEPITVFPSPGGDRFAAVRGNTLALRYVPGGLVAKPPASKSAFTITAPKDEVQPNNVKARVAAPPARPTFLAWHPAGRVIAGQPDGSILELGGNAVRFTAATREHKAPVRAWAAAGTTWDFATGDDRGGVGIWSNRAMKPVLFTASTHAITQLAFGPSGAHVAVADAVGEISLWELWEPVLVFRVKRPAPVKAIAFGPSDDAIIISHGKSVELWSLSELVKEAAPRR